MSYLYHGDHPVSIPAQSLMDIQPGATIAVTEAINHPDFTLL